MSDDIRIDRVELELESLSDAQAQRVAAALAGALAGQIAAWPPASPRDAGRPGRDDLDLDAIAEAVAARIFEMIAAERERNDEDASWH